MPLPGIDRRRLEELLDPDNVSIHPSGRARPAGMHAMTAIGMMSTEAIPSRRFGVARIKQLLPRGYVYCAYYWQTGERSFGGHACVIYGLSTKGIHIMDPDPNRGLIVRTPGFFAANSLAVFVGTSLMLQMSRAVSDALSDVGGSNPYTAAEIMSQFQ